MIVGSVSDGVRRERMTRLQAELERGFPIPLDMFSF